MYYIVYYCQKKKKKKNLAWVSGYAKQGVHGDGTILFDSVYIRQDLDSTHITIITLIY